MVLGDSNIEPAYFLRSETVYTESEKRQLFLRSYQFSREQSVGERIKKSLFRVKRVIWGRFKSARKLRKMFCFTLKNGVFCNNRRRRSFLRIQGNYWTTNPCFC